MLYYKPKFFKVQELVSKAVYEKFGDSALMLLDARILYSVDKIRAFYKEPVIVNDWHTGGKFQYRGFREPTCEQGAEFSDHKRGQAIDLNVLGINTEQVRNDVLSEPWHGAFKYITTVEMMVSWLHISCRNHDKINENIKLIYP